MTHRQPGGQPPQYPQQPYGQQWPPQQPGPYADRQPPQGPGYGPPPQQWQPPRRKRHVVRNILAGIGALVVAIVVIAVAASAGNHTIQNTGTGGGNGGNAGGGQAHASAPAAKTAGVGTAITLAGNDGGEQMTVTVTKVIADARGSDEFSQAPTGKRLYAVQFRLADTGTEVYSDSPSNGAAVTDSKHQSYESSFESVSGCQEFPGTENIATGASGLGCVVFEVPKSAVITQVQFTLDSGFGPQTGQWDVKG